MMYVMVINVADLQDSIILNDSSFQSSIWNCAIDVVKHGRKVVIQREFENAPPEIIVVISDIKELEEAKSKFDCLNIRINGNR